MARYSYVEALLGSETFAKVKDSKILVVGAGGIGCELRESALKSSWASQADQRSQESSPRRIRQYRDRELSTPTLVKCEVKADLIRSILIPSIYPT